MDVSNADFDYLISRMPAWGYRNEGMRTSECAEILGVYSEEDRSRMRERLKRLWKRTQKIRGLLRGREYRWWRWKYEIY